MSPARRRLAVALSASAVAGIDLGVKAWVQRNLPAGGLDGGLVDIRLGYNTGVAFSLGAGVSSWVVIAVTAAITLAVATFAWRTARAGGPSVLSALALILGGAVANLADRAADGVVTDYLHTGWWPTFNLADTAIVIGGLLLAVTAWRGTNGQNQTRGAADGVVPASVPPRPAD